MRDKHFDYFLEQQGNQSVPMQPEEDPIEKARRLLKQQKERQVNQGKKNISVIRIPLEFSEENKYKPDEILIQKEIIPKNLIRSAQTNPEKWDRDFDKLQNPDSNQDIGFATIKHYFTQPVKLYVVKEKAMARVRPDAGAYVIGTKNVFMSDDSFEVLPTATSDGKLTKIGAELLAHELRHTTQKGMVPAEREYQNAQVKGSFGDMHSEKGILYMKHPKEMGVRLAALKNLIDKKTFKTIANSATDKTYANILVDLLPKDEKTIIRFMFNENEWVEYTIDQMSKEYDLTSNKSFDLKKHLQNVALDIVEKLKFMNHDVDSIFKFYNTLDLQNKKKYLDELISVYDQVVKNNFKFNQLNYT